MTPKYGEKLIKSYILFFIILLTTSGVSAKTIKIGVIEHSPHIFVSDNKVHGPALDYLKAMLSKHFDNVIFTYLPTKRGILELNKGKIDLLFPISKTLEIKDYLPAALFHAVPGLCFNKEDFIPILSSTNQLDNLTIGVPAGVKLTPALVQSNAIIKAIEGSDVLFRGINLLLKRRIDSLYHPSPINIYHYTNPLSKKIACSYFHGYSTGLQIANSPNMDEADKIKLNDIYLGHLKNETYEYYFARRGNKK